MKKYNLNSYVYVKLNEKGRSIVQDEPIYSKYTIPDDNSIYKFQMWQFMKLFSPHLHMGLDIISEENSIYFDEIDLIEE